MNFVSEDLINPVIDLISDNEELFEKHMLEFAEEQPFLLAFLLSEGFDVLDEEEKGMLFYLAMIIYFSVVSGSQGELDMIELEKIQAADEDNWTQVDQKRHKTLKEIADYFFDGYGQEDLLAFVEDALMEDEEYEISNIGRNVIFVSMKSFIDVLSDLDSTIQ